jgi:putative modified peptide
MARPYHIKADISREKAISLIERLANDDDFRAEFTTNPRTILLDHRIDVSPETLPEEIVLPDKEKIAQLLEQARSMVPESASPFGLLALFVAFGAMPVITRGRPAADGTG